MGRLEVSRKAMSTPDWQARRTALRVMARAAGRKRTGSRATIFNPKRLNIVSALPHRIRDSKRHDILSKDRHAVRLPDQGCSGDPKKTGTAGELVSRAGKFGD